MRNTIHHMGRRCRNWDYCGTGCYSITLVLNDRSRPVLGTLVGPRVCPGIDAGERQGAYVALSELGRRIDAHFRKIPRFTPEIEVLGVQVMPEHLHGVLRVVRRMEKPLGEHLRGFKIGATKIARELGALSCPGIDAREQRGAGLFADGFVDSILGDEAAVANGLAYIADNPRRLWVKRAHPELFRVLCDLRVELPLPGIDAGAQAHFAAIGNRELLKMPHLLQIQCSRDFFAYRRQPNGDLVKEEPYSVVTPEFEEKAACLLAAAAHGAVLVSPCISHGEKEIARRAFKAGYKVITLSNKGFNPLYKPGGRSFDQCADGNLLMLAPATWEYLPGEKKITRLDACILNRIAQLLSGEGAVEINYRGTKLGDVDRYVATVLKIGRAE